MQPTKFHSKITSCLHGKHLCISANGTARRTFYVQATPIAAVLLVDHKAATVARELVKLVSRDGVSVKLLADNGSNFESDLMKDIYCMLSLYIGTYM